MIRGIILDMDGTFIDSNDSHALAFEKALREKGYSIPFEKIRPLIGMGGKILLSQLLGLQEGSPVIKEVSKRHGEIFKKEFFPQIKTFPKGRELVQAMKRQGLKLVVGTSAQESELKDLLKIAGIKDLIDGSPPPMWKKQSLNRTSFNAP